MRMIIGALLAATGLSAATPAAAELSSAVRHHP